MVNGNFDSKFKSYLEDCKRQNNIKSVIIITNKQCVIATLSEMNFIQFSENDDSHSKLISYLENLIHPNDNTTGWESYKLHDTYLLLEGPELTINLPLSNNLSINQAGFLIDVLGDICKFNAENNDLISIDIISSTDYKEYKTHNLYIIAKYILSKITEKSLTSEEKIIGKTSINSDFDNPKVYEKQ